MLLPAHAACHASMRCVALRAHALRCCIAALLMQVDALDY